MTIRDEFSKITKDIVAKRAAFICSNPKCRAMTIAPSDSDDNKVVSLYKIAHITAAAEGGPRYNGLLSSAERKSAANAMFFCSSCSDLVDKNNGIDFTVEQLENWKDEHEEWVKNNLNKNPFDSKTTIVDGHHEARGINSEVVALKIEGGGKGVIIKPGTSAIAEGLGGTVIGTHIIT